MPYGCKMNKIRLIETVLVKQLIISDNSRVRGYLTQFTNDACAGIS